MKKDGKEESITPYLIRQRGRKGRRSRGGKASAASIEETTNEIQTEGDKGGWKIGGLIYMSSRLHALNRELSLIILLLFPPPSLPLLPSLPPPPPRLPYRPWPEKKSPILRKTEQGWEGGGG